MLRDEISNAQRLIKTDTVQITIGEIARMYEEAELDVLPDFQRLFRWSIEKKSSFIESILIGIPIPPAFAYENADGTWELIDGLQRISTILEFMGLLRNPDHDSEKRASRLTTTKYLPALNGACWSDEDEETLSKGLKLLFRRARLDFQVLKHPSDPRTKFDLFQRLNRGGAYANPQEVRSCSMVLANPALTRKIKEWSASDAFKSIFQVSTKDMENQKNVEYAVRLLVHSARDFTNDSDVQEFFDKSIIDILVSPDADSVLEAAEWATAELFQKFGDRALLPMGNNAAEAANRFSLRALEGVAAGVARNKMAIQSSSNPDAFVTDRVVGFWDNLEVQEMTGAGLRGTTRLQRTVPFGAKWFNPNA